jgi:hypothetical protein
MNNQNKEPIPNPDQPHNSSEKQSSSNQGSTPPPVYRDWREQRHAERMARREARWQRHAGRPYGWFGGFVLILLGVILLLENMGFLTFANWWALLILIPAFWAFVTAREIYQYNSVVTRGVVGLLAIGILLTILSLAFLLSFTFGQYWPVLLIVAGVVILITALFPR